MTSAYRGGKDGSGGFVNKSEMATKTFKSGLTQKAQEWTIRKEKGHSLPDQWESHAGRNADC